MLDILSLQLYRLSLHYYPFLLVIKFYFQLFFSQSKDSHIPVEDLLCHHYHFFFLMEIYFVFLKFFLLPLLRVNFLIFEIFLILDFNILKIHHFKVFHQHSKSLQIIGQTESLSLTTLTNPLNFLHLPTTTTTTTTTNCYYYYNQISRDFVNSISIYQGNHH